MTQVNRLLSVPFVLLWISLAMIPTFVTLYQRAAPASFWLTVNTVHVFDTVVGTSPKMEVDRTVIQPFKADWVAEVEEYDETVGVFSVRCTGKGTNSYTPTDQIPADVDLNWWTWPTKCELQKGKWRVQTLWTIQPPGYPSKEVRITSNTFEVM